jgi:hypothetical protein
MLDIEKCRLVVINVPAEQTKFKEPAKLIK